MPLLTVAPTPATAAAPPGGNGDRYGLADGFELATERLKCGRCLVLELDDRRGDRLADGFKAAADRLDLGGGDVLDRHGGGDLFAAAARTAWIIAWPFLDAAVASSRALYFLSHVLVRLFFGVVDLALKGRLFFAHRPESGGRVILKGDHAGHNMHQPSPPKPQNCRRSS